MPDNVHFRLNRDDGQIFRAVGTLVRRRYFLPAILVIVGASVAYFLMQVNHHPLPRVVFDGLIAFGFALVALPSATFGLQSRTLWALAGNAARFDCRLDESGVHLRTDDSELSSPWRTFSGFAETRDALVLLTQSYPILVVPKVDVGGDPDVLAVKAVLGSHIGSSKIRPKT